MEKTRTLTTQAEPTWDVATLFPAQGHWSEEEYLALDTNHLVEFSRGQLEVLAMPTYSHQKIVRLLFLALERFLGRGIAGEVMFAPMRVQVRSGKFREPDILFMFDAHADRRTEQYWIGADLVMEVVSPDDPTRDTVTKRREYAEAGIPEYWIVDPTTRLVTVLTLKIGSYDVHGEFGEGRQATSALLTGFEMDVSALFAEIEL